MEIVKKQELELLSCMIVEPSLIDDASILNELIYYDDLYQAIKKVYAKHETIIQHEVNKIYPITNKEWFELAEWYKFPHLRQFSQRMGVYMQTAIDLKVEKMIQEGKSSVDVYNVIDQYNKNAYTEKIGDMYTHMETAIKMFENTNIYQTGFNCLDSKLKIRSGNLIVLSGTPKTGKSTMALNIANNMVDSGKKIAYFSFEMSTNEVVQKLVSLRSGFVCDTADKFAKNSRYITKESFNNNFKLISSTAYTVPAIKKYVIENKIQILFIDQLDCMPINMNEKRHDLRVGANVMALKHLAIELNIAVVLLHQLNRASKGGEMPEVHHLKDSQIVEQKADAVILLNQDSSNDNVIWCKIGANRMGGTGTATLNFIKRISKFEEIR